MSDASADPFDHASDVEAAFREAAIAYTRTQEKAPADFDGESCTQCGLEIPAERLALGKFRCVSCQQMREKYKKLFGR